MNIQETNHQLFKFVTQVNITKANKDIHNFKYSSSIMQILTVRETVQFKPFTYIQCSTHLIYVQHFLQYGSDPLKYPKKYRKLNQKQNACFHIPKQGRQYLINTTLILKHKEHVEQVWLWWLRNYPRILANCKKTSSLFLTMYLASTKGSLTATTSISSLEVATRRTNLPIRPKPA